IGIDALRNMQGVDVTRDLVAAYPTLPADFQFALIPVLGGKRHPLVASILTEGAKSREPATRLAAIAALGDAMLPEIAEVVAGIARTGTPEERAAALRSLLSLADGLREAGRAKESGKTYVMALNAGGEGDQELRRRALQGIADCPVAEGYEAAKAAAGDKETNDLAIRLMVGVAGALVQVKQNDKALELYERVRQMNPTTELMQAIAKGMVAAGAKVDVQALMGTITNWWVVGPFELGEQNQGWNVEYVGEPDVNLVGRYMSGKRRVQWTPVTSDDPHGKINLRATVADADNAIAYAYTEITVKEATDAVLLVGTDDSERIWLNGKKVFELWTARGLTVDQDKVPARLEAGVNRILMKVWQNTLGWEFCMRVTQPDGRPVQFTQKAP
ncbi:MAG: HEAT repeat domain-containing protein, partial [Planctomycetes bacterium]|nr:HEAT repeat domain-containing protein [Planctomycetota bacterium]